MRRGGARLGCFSAVFSPLAPSSPFSFGGRMSTDVMIYTNDLSKSFGSFRAVDKINFEVRRGEVVGFLGPNGAGKSTTMRILTCFIAPTSGTVRIKGYDVFDSSLDVRR